MLIHGHQYHICIQKKNHLFWIFKTTGKVYCLIQKKELKKIWEDEKIFSIVMYNRVQHKDNQKLPELPYYAEKLVKQQYHSSNIEEADIIF